MKNLSRNFCVRETKSESRLRRPASKSSLPLVGNWRGSALKKMGLKVSYGANAVDENWDADGSTTVEKRVEDLHRAFADPNVKAVLP